MKRIFTPILAALVAALAVSAAQASPDFGNYFKQDADLTAYASCRSKLGLDGSTGACFDLTIKIANEHFNGDVLALHNWWVANEHDAVRGVKRDFT